MDEVVEGALSDARILAEEGYDGLVVENYASSAATSRRRRWPPWRT